MLLKKVMFYIQRFFFYILWNQIPRKIQYLFSNQLSQFLKSPLSINLIQPFCQRYKISEYSLSNYEPASGHQTYQSFQDFFTRKMRQIPQLTSSMIWPCEGFLCDQVHLQPSNDGITYVKSQKVCIKDIFKITSMESLYNYHFVNIFLHNHNYHRFHVPIRSRVEEVVHIPGKLQILRPWFYDKRNINEPSFLNERIIIKLRDFEDKIWYMALVAGMGVGNIRLHQKCKPGNIFQIGEEIGLFLLGSTCCLAIPHKINELKSMSLIKVCDPLPLSNHNVISQTNFNFSQVSSNSVQLNEVAESDFHYSQQL